MSDKLENTAPSIQFFHINSASKAPIINQNLHSQRPYVFFGRDNLFPQRLIALLDNSSTHAAIIDAKIKFIAGGGWIFDGEDAENDTARDVLSEVVMGFDNGEYSDRLANDLALFEGYYLNVVWETGGAIAKAQHKDFTMIRSSKMNVETKRIDSWWISPDWAKATKKRNFEGVDKIYKPIEIPTYDPDNITNAGFSEDVADKGQCWQIKSYKPSKIFYAEPMYLGALNWIDIEGKVPNLHISNLDNGMVGSQHIHLFEDLSDPNKRRDVENSINNKFAGTGNAGTIVVTWSTDKDLAPLINDLPNNNTHEMFGMLSARVNEQLVVAHRFPKVLTGLETKTGLGGQALAIRESLEYLQNTVIAPYQKKITDPLNSILRTHGIDTKVNIAQLNPINILGDAGLIRETITVDEFRTKIQGMPPLEDDQVTISGATPQEEPNGS